MSVKTKRAVWLSSAVTFAFAGFATVALADDADKVKITEGVQVAQAEEAPPPAAAEEDKKVERVVVTGSRLRKTEFTSSAPIQVITREESTLEGLNDTADILQGSSLATGSGQVNNTFTGFVNNGGPGANTLSLRGLGAQRTLVLVNGRRVSPAGTRGQTGQADLNTIPESMIDRIEILKDGGSSIYGSDAVAGVVNIITRKNYDGLTVSGSTNQTFEGGGATYKVDALWGDTFDRGHIMVNGEFFRREELTWGDRDYFACLDDYSVRDSGVTGRISSGGVGSILDIIDPATGKSKCFNLLEGVVDLVGAFPATNGRFQPDPTAVAGGGVFGLDRAGLKRVALTYPQVANRLFGTNAAFTANQAYDALTPAQRATVEAEWRASQGLTSANDPRQLGRSVISPVDRYSAFVEGSYDLFAGMEAYTELAFVRRESEQHSVRQLFPGVAATNANNPFGVTIQPVILVPFNSDQQVDFYRGVLGVKGDFSDKMPIFGNWSYDLFLQHSRAEANYSSDIIYNDRVVATTGAGTCNQAAITISGGSCASIPGGIRWADPLVLDGHFNAAETAFLFGYETGSTTYTQSIINGVITGDVVQVPYGTIAGALGFEARRDEIDDTPPDNARANNYWGLTSAGRTAGSDSVVETFAEVSIPLLAGMKFAEELTLDASARYTNYDSYGDGSTYKLGLNYQITPEYRLRGTTGTSFRAPALYELYLANQSAFANQTAVDPCHQWGLNPNINPIIAASCDLLGIPGAYNAAVHSSALIITGGGAGLNAETSEARTVGFIWTPDWIDLSVAVDYWEFEVNNEIATFGSGNIVTQCHLQPPQVSPANPFCSLFTRDLTPGPNFGKIVQVNNSYVNIANQTTDGIDLAARYEHEFSFGRLLINGDFTWTFTDEVRTFITFPTTDFNGTILDADFTANVDVRFDWTDWTFVWNVDMASRASNHEFNGTNLFVFRASPFVGEYKGYTEFSAVHDLSARYRADDWSIVFGVQNIFDEPPPATSATGGGTRTGHSIAVSGPYDLLGRRAFVNLTKEF